MSAPKPFIPRDKPKSWVIGICTGLIGLAVGLIGLAFAWLGIRSIQAIATALFIVCWGSFAAAWLVFVFRLISGCYSNLQSKPWGEQIW